MNTLYPIFLRLESLKLLIVGGGKVCMEKLNFILKSSPDAVITIVADKISETIKTQYQSNKKIHFIEKPFEPDDVLGFQIIIAATNNKTTNLEIYKAAKNNNILINVADTPKLCDFYLGSIVTKGDLKIGISTNGKSPTMAKRMREFFEDVLPEDLDSLIQNLNIYREELKENLEDKTNKLNELTRHFRKEL